MERYLVFRNVRRSSTEKMLNYLRERIRINVRIVNFVNMWVKSFSQLKSNFKPKLLSDLGFKIMDGFGQYFTSFAFFKYDHANTTYGWDVKN